MSVVSPAWRPTATDRFFLGWARFTALLPAPALPWFTARWRDETARGVSSSALVIRSGRPPRTTVAELYQTQRLPMVRLALMLVDDLPTAEDVVQDAFTALCRRHGESLRDVDDATAYLVTVVCNTARSLLRRRRTARAYAPPNAQHGPPSDEYVLLKEEHSQVLAALRQLTSRQREVLVLRYWSNLSEAQIAHTLGLSRGAVKSTASRALDALERLLVR